MNAQEGMLGMGLVSTVQAVFMQCSPKIFQVSIQHCNLLCMYQTLFYCIKCVTYKRVVNVLSSLHDRYDCWLFD